MKFRWLGLLTLLLLPLQGQEPESIRVNQLSPSVYRSAGYSNHAAQVVGDRMQMIWVGRDRFSFPFYAEVDLKEQKVMRLMKLTEERGRGKGLRMNPAIGRYQGHTWTAWLEEIRRQRRSNFMLNLLEVEPAGDEPAAEESGDPGESESPEAPQGPDHRQIFDLGRLVAPVTFHEAEQGFFALTYSQDKELDFRICLFRLGPDLQWTQVRSASEIEGMKPVLVRDGKGLGLYFMRQQGIYRSLSDDGQRWSASEEVGEGLATSVQAVAVEDGVAVAWTISGQEAVEIYLSRCLGETCSPPSKIFQRSGRLGRIVLSSQPDTGQLFMLLSYWD
ncbi:MAG TPA: hypothetical protein VLV83_17800, partial [Acidobacteriota bacterium]|nr:hypothetical protein [Acidobacteriota bacterium]